jgi:chromosome partitioning protein
MEQPLSITLMEGRGVHALRTLAVINQKGGCGKTTTAINLAATFAHLGYKTLLVDMDPQSHCALGLAVPENRLEGSVGDALLRDGVDPEEILWQISANLDLLPSTMALSATEHQLNEKPDRDTRLGRFLNTIRNRHDLCIIDCPPTMGLLTFNALRAAAEVLIPVEIGYFALKGSAKQAKAIEVLAERCGHKVGLHILPTMYDGQIKITQQIVEELRRQFGSLVLPMPIHYNVKLKEAASFGQPITEYDPSSRSTGDFRALAKHLLSTHAKPRHTTARADEATPTLSIPMPTEATGPADSSRMQVPANSRVADLVQRAKALAKRTRQLNDRVPTESDLAFLRIESQREAQELPPLDAERAQSLRGRVRGLYGVNVTQQGALFIQPETESKRLSIVGDFNDWAPEATPLHLSCRLGVWQACLDLPPGRYHYQLLIDNKTVVDPHNQQSESDAQGRLTNVFEITG